MNDNDLSKYSVKGLMHQFIQSHTLIYTGLHILLGGFSKKSLEISNLARENKVLMRLRKRYKHIIEAYSYDSDTTITADTTPSKIWICWLQGMSEAPEIVKRCYESVKKNCADREIILLTEKNYKEYVSFPDYLQKKIDNGTITKTHFSDLLRVELLTTHGGTWIDATVFVSGTNYPNCFFDTDFFVFQTCKPGLSGHPTRVSSWFMSARPNCKILCLTKVLLYDYWKKKNYLESYFLLHDLLELSIERFPDDWAAVKVFDNSSPHILQYQLEKSFSSDNWELLKSSTAIHKLTYKNLSLKEGSYLSKFLAMEL